MDPLDRSLNSAEETIAMTVTLALDIRDVVK
jgi:hypothetical protein